MLIVHTMLSDKPVALSRKMYRRSVRDAPNLPIGHRASANLSVLFSHIFSQYERAEFDGTVDKQAFTSANLSLQSTMVDASAKASKLFRRRDISEEQLMGCAALCETCRGCTYKVNIHWKCSCSNTGVG